MAPRLYYTCKRYLRLEVEAEEVLADAFYTIFTRLDQLKETAAFSAWARKITVNLCLALIRKKGLLSISLEDIPEPVAYSAWPSQLEEEDLLGLLEHLPDGCRTVFNLFVLEGYSHKEIAVMLQISEGTSKSQLNFSKTKLKELVKRFYYPKEVNNGTAG